jgi:hypothetical protein
VTRTYQYEDRELYYVAWEARKEQMEGKKPAWDYDCMAVTGRHPIWVKQFAYFTGYGADVRKELKDIYAWMTIEDLYQKIWDGRWSYSKTGSWGTPVHAELSDGREAIINVIKPVLQCEEPDIGVSFDYHAD